MKRHSKILSAAAVVFLVTWNTSAWVYSQGPTGIIEYGGHCVGLDNFPIGYTEYRYSTDASGQVILVSRWPRLPQPGDMLHRGTKVYLGPVSFSVPMRPLPFVLVDGVILLIAFGLADIGWKALKRRQYEI